MERRAGHRRRRGLLRNDGRLVQGGGRAYRRAAMAVQDRLRDHRPAGRLSRPGRARICRRPVGRRRLGRRDRVRQSRSARPDRRARLRRRDGRPEEEDHTREGRSMSSPCRLPEPRGARCSPAPCSLPRRRRAARRGEPPISRRPKSARRRCRPRRCSPAAASRRRRTRAASTTTATRRRSARGKRLFELVQLLGLPFPRRGRHGAGADGQSVALWRAARPDLCDASCRAGRTGCRPGRARFPTSRSGRSPPIVQVAVRAQSANGPVATMPGAAGAAERRHPPKPRSEAPGAQIDAAMRWRCAVLRRAGAAARRRRRRRRASCGSAPTRTTCRSPTQAARASRTRSSH